MNGVDLLVKLAKCKEKKSREAEQVIHEVNRILNKDLYSEKNILNNLKHYNKLNELINEEEVDETLVFKLSEIKEIALTYRLRFADSQCYRFEFPYESVLKIEYLDSVFNKSLKGFKVLSTGGFFKDEKNTDSALLFAPTSSGNYYLVHKWGKELKWYRKYINWPLKNIENLFISLLVLTLIVAISLPISWITYDSSVPYWCNYRIGIFFHLFIFNMGFTAYFTFAFGRNLGTMNWNSDKDFG